ncbi:MAG: ABC transporter ATP-binding protein/permease [Treponema sp.]|nr:ABC transporter ATP-binding protein/permease [Treponema sp.]
MISNFVLVFSVASIIEKRGSSIELPAFLIILSVFATFLCNQFISVASFNSSKEVKKTLRTLIYEKLLRLGPEYQEKTETAKIIQWTVEGVEQIEVWFGQYLPQFFYSMIAALFTFAVLAFIHLKMALILLVCVPLIPVSIVAVQKIAKKLLGRYMDQYANLADNYLENLQGLTTLKIYNADEERQKKLGLDAENFRRITMKVLSFQLNSIIIMDTVAYGGAGLGIMTALSSYLNGQLSLEHALICILLSADFFIPLRRLGSYFHTAMNGTTASNNIFALLDVEEGRGSLPLRASQKSVAILSSGGHPRNAPENSSYNGDRPLVFETQNLSYKFGERTVLNNISLTIPAGSFTAFIGKSGSGKSTTAKVLAGINSNYEGTVKIMGTDLSSLAPESLYKFCTYISHRDWIFKGTIRDCLWEGNPSATEEEMWNVLSQVQLKEFVEQNGGLDFQIQEDAANLSGGQKQRLSIARALLHNSEVYIFDEATSNIDVESETAILELLHKLKSTKTIIMISHRKENCKDADQIYEFENGTLRGVQCFSCGHAELDSASQGGN